MGITDPDAIPRGSLCVLDTNILIYAEHGTSAQSQRVLRRIAANEIEGILPQPAWQELMHKLMLAEALQAGMISGGNPARQLAAKPASVRRLSQYKDKVRVLIEMGLGFEPCTRKDLFEEAPRLQERYGFLTNDSVLLAMAIRLKADTLVTADAAFKPVTEITICTPSDLH